MFSVKTYEVLAVCVRSEVHFVSRPGGFMCSNNVSPGFQHSSSLVWVGRADKRGQQACFTLDEALERAGVRSQRNLRAVPG